MKKKILDRYPCDSCGRRVVDIATQRVNDLYDDYDKNAPFLKKGLNDYMVEYLIESVRELDREPFRVNFSLAEELDDPIKERVRNSVASYFDYLLEKNLRQLHAIFRTASILLLLGVVMLSVSIYMNYRFELSDTIVKRVLAEGLLIASWVSLWEALAGLLLNWQPAMRERIIYRRLLRSEVTFDRTPVPENPAVF
jgi:AcrR family transcriptional regulator